MATEVKLPQWAMMLSDGEVVEWQVKEGDIVKEGDVLCYAEEEKVAEDILSPVDGMVLKICVPAGETVPVLTTLCIIGEAGEAV